MRLYWLAGASFLAFGACTPAPAPAEQPSNEALLDTVIEGPERGSLDWAIAGEWRSAEEKARDVWRNPSETLSFFEVANDETVIEVWPGTGWYSNILAPYLNAGGGRLIAAGFDLEAAEESRRPRIEAAITNYAEAFGNDPDLYGTVDISAFSNISGQFAPPETADTILTFRNVHNWMAGDYTAKFFLDAYEALKPGGVLGVVEHRLPSSEEQDPRARSGYVHEDFVKALAIAAGFEFVEASEINANPADSTDHPFGVWTLPPISATASFDGTSVEGFDPSLYTSIGESDRMTLKFSKPAPTETDSDLEPVE